VTADPRPWAGALLRAAHATTRTQARDHINTAVLRGATLDQARQALAQWDAANPLEAGRCLCSHHVSAHEDGGNCYSVACGCASYRRPAVTV
jgi:hypothetical protein